MKTEPKEYYAARERAERAAADKALSPEARQAHEEMAQAYAQLAEQAPAGKQPDEERPAA
jgi:hypothetical protein